MAQPTANRGARRAENVVWQQIAHLAMLVEAALARALDEPPPDSRLRGAARLLESMRYSLGAPGKRLRPLLMLASVHAAGGEAERFVRFATGVEMIHAYSLIHDDLPAMDDDVLRRGQPTNHIVFGDGIAILAGDGLLSEAFVAMLEPVAEPSLQLEVVREVALAAGRQGMVGGQAADLLAEGQPPNEETLRAIHACKTGALLLASVRAGARLAGANDTTLDVLTRFGESFGLAFQIADDIKDEIAPTEVSGKHPHGDRAAGKMTYPALFGIAGARRRCQAELERALAILARLEGRAELLDCIARDAVAPAFSPAAAD